MGDSKHGRDARILTGEDTPEMQHNRLKLGDSIGTIEHPYFTNAFRKNTERKGKIGAAPKFAALMKQNEWKGDDALSAYQRRHERRRSLRPLHAHLSEGPSVLSALELKPSAAKKEASGVEDDMQKRLEKARVAAKLKKSEEAKEDEAAEKKQKKENSLFQESKARRAVVEKRKVAKAWFKMACNGRVRAAIVKDGAVKAIALLATIPDDTIGAYCTDALCELSDLPENRSQMIEDGGAKALLKCAKSMSPATQYSCALAFGSLACETGYEMDLIEMGILGELMDTNMSRNKTDVYTAAVARAVFNFACVDEYMMSVASATPRLEDVVRASFALSSASSEDVRVLCYRSMTCLARVGPLRKLMVKLGVVGIMKAFGESNNPEGSLICALTLCLFSFTREVRVEMMAQGAGRAALAVVKQAMESMGHGSAADDGDRDGGSDNGSTQSNGEGLFMDIVCLTVATLTNLALTPTTRTLIINDGVVPIILSLIEHDDEPVKRACAATMRGLTLDDSTEIITEIVQQGGLEAILRLCNVTDMLILRNCSAALCNILAHEALLDDLFTPGVGLVDDTIAQTTVNVVIDLLRSNDLDILRTCTLCLYNLSCITIEGCREMLVAAGAVAACVRVVADIEFLPQEVRSLYAGTLLNLSLSRQHSDRMHTDHAMQALVSLIESIATLDVTRNCCATMYNMVGTTEHRGIVIDDPEAVETLLKLSVSKLDDARILCGAILCRLASDPTCATRFVDLGLLQALITLVSWRDQTTRQRCIVAAVTLAEGDGMRSRLVEEGAVPALISLLSSHDKIMRRDCAAALCDLTCTEGGAFKATIVEQGAVSALTVVALVRSTEDSITRKVCSKALYNLLDATETIERMVEEGLVGALTALSGIDDETMEFFAEGVCNVAQYKCGRVEVGKERVLRTLLAIVDGENTTMHRACAQTLCNLSCFDDGAYCFPVAKAGGLGALKKLVTTFQSSSDREMEEVCTRTLCALACDETSREIFLEDGGLHLLMGLGQTDNDDIKFQCANVLLSLALGGNTCILAVRQGAMALLFTIAHSKEKRTQLACARSLLLFSEQEENRLSIIEQKGVGIAKLLSQTELGRKIAMRALTLLSRTKTEEAAAKMVESSAVLEIGNMIGLSIEGGVLENDGEEGGRLSWEMVLTLSEDDESMLMDACIAVTQLSVKSNTSRMVADNATECLVAFLEKFPNRESVRERVACALRNLSCHSGNLVRMVKAGASKWLIKLSSDPALQTQQHCMVGLCNMADMEDVRPLLVSQGAVTAIMNLSKILRNEEVARQCAVSLSNLAIAEGTHDGLVKGGAVSALMWLSKEGMAFDEDEEEPWEDDYLPETKKWGGESGVDKAGVGPVSESNEIVTAHVRVGLPNVRGGVTDFRDLSSISVQRKTPTLCSMVWHMASVTTSVKPPPGPELPSLSLISPETEPEVSPNAAMGADDDDENINQDSLGMSRVMDITRHYIGRYTRIPRSRESRDLLRTMRETEKPKPVLVHSKRLPSNAVVLDSSPPQAKSKDDAKTEPRRNVQKLPALNSQDLVTSMSMPNMLEYPAEDHYPRMKTPGPPLQVPPSDPVVNQFTDTGSFLKHLDGILGPFDGSVVLGSESGSVVSDGSSFVSGARSVGSQMIKGVGMHGNNRPPKKMRPKSKDRESWPFAPGPDDSDDSSLIPLVHVDRIAEHRCLGNEGKRSHK